MLNLLLKQIIAAIEATYRVRDSKEGSTGNGAGSDDDGTGGAATGIEGVNTAIATEGGEVEGKDGDEQVIEKEQYVGSKESNPTQRPLNIDTSDLSQQEVDDMLLTSSGELFKTDKEIKEEATKKGEADKKAAEEKKKTEEGKGDKEGKEVEDKEVDEGKEGGKDKEKSKDELKIKVDDFFESTGMTQEIVDKLPDETKEKLVDRFLKPSEETAELKKVQEQLATLQLTLDTLDKDDIMSARAAEINTGKRYVARPESIVNDALIDKIDKLLEDEDKKGVKELLLSSVKEQIKHERSVGETKAEIRENEKIVNKIVKKVGELDDRLKLDEDDITKINKNHKLYKKYTEKGGVYDFLKFCQNMNYTASQLKSMGPKSLHAAYATKQGWDVKRDQKIVDITRSDLLEGIKNPKKYAKSLGSPKKVLPESKKSTGIDRESLITELVEGKMNSKTYESLLEINDGNEKAIAILDQIWEQANQKYQQELQTK